MSIQKSHLRTARDTVKDSSHLAQINFLRITSDVVKDLINADLSEIKSMKQELSLLENASLYIHHHAGHHVCFACLNRETKKETGITRDTERILALARREFLENRIIAIERNTKRLSRILETAEGICHENRLRKRLVRFSESGIDLSRVLFTKEQNEWIDLPYTPNPFHPENLTCSTRAGFPVRSNSEVRLANDLVSIGLPFRYDDLVIIKNEYGDDPPFRNNYFADFKIPNLIGGITIHEHLGAFQIDRYSDNALQRLNDYHKHTIYELPSRPVKPQEFTWSLESDLHDPALFRNLIRRILLPCTF